MFFSAVQNITRTDFKRNDCRRWFSLFKVLKCMVDFQSDGRKLDDTRYKKKKKKTVVSIPY